MGVCSREGRGGAPHLISVYFTAGAGVRGATDGGVFQRRKGWGTSFN